MKVLKRHLKAPTIVSWGQRHRWTTITFSKLKMMSSSQTCVYKGREDNNIYAELPSQYTTTYLSIKTPIVTLTTVGSTSIIILCKPAPLLVSV